MLDDVVELEVQTAELRRHGLRWIWRAVTAMGGGNAAFVGATSGGLLVWEADHRAPQGVQEGHSSLQCVLPLNSQAHSKGCYGHQILGSPISCIIPTLISTTTAITSTSTP